MDELLEQLAIESADILSEVENYQWSLGEKANTVIERTGYKSLVDFAKRIENICGVKRSAGSYRMYAYVWKRSTELGLPKDILFSACQDIVFSKEPVKYALMAQKGLSGTDIRKAIYNDKYAQSD